MKVLHEDVAKDEVALERFKREYEINASLPHEHIVKVLDFQRDALSKAWLLVMEFLDGEELRYVLKREKVLPPERLVRMLSQVAIGLDEAHAPRFIHRDLKPDNLFLCGTREGDIVKLLDFGSVKDKGSNRKKLTVLGTTIGSPYYMAPEQAQGLETLDARADVFALAAIAYECVTGEVPFSGTNGPSILLAILTKDPEPPSIKGAKREVPDRSGDGRRHRRGAREEPEHPHEDRRRAGGRGGRRVRPVRAITGSGRSFLNRISRCRSQKPCRAECSPRSPRSWSPPIRLPRRARGLTERDRWSREWRTRLAPAGIGSRSVRRSDAQARVAPAADCRAARPGRRRRRHAGCHGALSQETRSPS